MKLQSLVLLWMTLLVSPVMAGESGRCLLAIDIGHDRKASGATSARGASEWSFNVSLATKLYEAVLAQGMRATLINPTGSPIKLPERPRIAQEAGATLFIAIHHDSVQPHYLLPWEWNGVPYRYCDRFSGYGLFVSGKNARFEESLKVAQDIADALLRKDLRPALHHSQARRERCVVELRKMGGAGC